MLDGAPESETEAVDIALPAALKTLTFPGLLVGHRVIAPGDENALLLSEAQSITSTSTASRRATGAARIVARNLLASLGHKDVALIRGEGGAPLWPAGICGSLAHDDDIAVAAVGFTRDVGAIGIDVEPAVPLSPEMIELVATANERRALQDDQLAATMLFAAKEAVYKAAYPSDHVFLEFHDIEVNLAARQAITRSGRTFALRYLTRPRIVVLARG